MLLDGVVEKWTIRLGRRQVTVGNAKPGEWTNLSVDLTSFICSVSWRTSRACTFVLGNLRGPHPSGDVIVTLLHIQNKLKLMDICQVGMRVYVDREAYAALVTLARNTGNSWCKTMSKQVE